MDYRENRACDLTYFGLVPEAIGLGYGKYLLKFAVKESWKNNDIDLLTVNTNSLDHPLALHLYKEVGFKINRIESETRILTKARTISDDQINRIGK